MKQAFVWVALVVSAAALAAACSAKPIAVPVAPPPSLPSPAPAAATPGAVRDAGAPGREDAAWATTLAAARKEAVVTAYSFHFVGDVGRALAKVLWERHGIRLEVVSGPGMTLIERIKAEQRAGKQLADLITTAPSILFVAKGEGLLTEVPDLPVLREQQVWLADPRYDPDGYVVATYTLAYSPYINTKLVKKEDYPKSFRDMLAPRWKGKIIFPDPDTIPTPVNTYWVMSDRKVLDQEYFRQLARQDLRFVPTERENLGALVRGEGEVAFTSVGSVAGRLVDEGAPIQALGMEEGTLLALGGTFSVIKDRPHPNATRVFVNWLLGPEGQKVFGEAQRNSSIRKDVPDFTPSGARPEIRRALPMTARDEKEVARIMRERELSKLLGR